jgi:hypothetical protein
METWVGRTEAACASGQGRLRSKAPPPLNPITTQPDLTGSETGACQLIMHGMQEMQAPSRNRDYTRLRVAAYIRLFSFPFTQQKGIVARYEISLRCSTCSACLPSQCITNPSPGGPHPHRASYPLRHSRVGWPLRLRPAHWGGHPHLSLLRKETPSSSRHRVNSSPTAGRTGHRRLMRMHRRFCRSLALLLISRQRSLFGGLTHSRTLACRVSLVLHRNTIARKASATASKYPIPLFHPSNPPLPSGKPSLLT